MLSSEIVGALRAMLQWLQLQDGFRTLFYMESYRWWPAWPPDPTGEGGHIDWGDIGAVYHSIVYATPSTLLFVLTLVRQAENEPFRNLRSIHCFLRYWRKQCRWSCWSLVSWSLLHRLTTASYPSLRWQMAVAGGHPIFERDAHFFYNRLVCHQAADPFFASTTSSILFIHVGRSQCPKPETSC